jgi:pimeloyl-ACP methyl ester carboxylesterase
MIIWGLKDRLLAPELLARWRDLLPDASVLELAGAGHSPHREEPAAVSELIGAFLESTSPAWRSRAARRRAERACA